MNISRRDFIKYSVMSGLTLSLSDALAKELLADNSSLKIASYFHHTENGTIICDLCHHSCELSQGQVGECHCRVNIDGTLYNLNYNQPVAIHLDPVAKLPMKHVFPRESLLSVGTAGCNFSCLYCINHHISQKSPKMVKSLYKTPKNLVDMALKLKAPGIAFTYNEPTVAYEFMFDTFAIAKKNGLKTFFHTNGSMNQTPLESLLAITDGVVVDLKSITGKTYREMTGGDLDHVKSFLRLSFQSGCFLEIVNLLVPGYNDSPKEIDSLCRFIGKDLSTYTPVHFSRFFPKFQLSHLPPTPSTTVKRATDIAGKNGLHFVYTNNIKNPHNDTFCPNCHQLLIQRREGMVGTINIDNGRCNACGRKIPGIWEV